MQKIIPHLWFDSEAEEAVNFYVSVFKNSAIHDVSRYGNEGQEITGRKPGTVMSVRFELDGQQFMAINGGPEFKFSEAISFMVQCKDQEEVDYYWDKLTADGGSEGPCGWLKDKFGLSWQVIPEQLGALLGNSDRAKADRAMKAMLQMKKIDVAELERAAEAA